MKTDDADGVERVLRERRAANQRREITPAFVPMICIYLEYYSVVIVVVVLQGPINCEDEDGIIHSPSYTPHTLPPHTDEPSPTHPPPAA